MTFFLIGQLVSNLIIFIFYKRRTRKMIELYQTQAALDRGHIARLEAELKAYKWKGNQE